jgi:hypothetical protein
VAPNLPFGSPIFTNVILHYFWQICYMSRYFYLILTPMADLQLRYMTNVIILTLQSSTFLFCVVTYHFHLLMICISPSWFDTQEHVLRMRTFQNEANYLQKGWWCKVMMNLVWSHHFANSMVAIMTLFAITNYHWPICWMICFILFVRLSFPYWLWRRVSPYT